MEQEAEKLVLQCVLQYIGGPSKVCGVPLSELEERLTPKVLMLRGNTPLATVLKASDKVSLIQLADQDIRVVLAPTLMLQRIVRIFDKVAKDKGGSVSDEDLWKGFQSKLHVDLSICALHTKLLSANAVIQFWRESKRNGAVAQPSAAAPKPSPAITPGPSPANTPRDSTVSPHPPAPPVKETELTVSALQETRFQAFINSLSRTEHPMDLEVHFNSN